jgi:hypothetical protein
MCSKAFLEQALYNVKVFYVELITFGLGEPSDILELVDVDSWYHPFPNKWLIQCCWKPTSMMVGLFPLQDGSSNGCSYNIDA